MYKNIVCLIIILLLIVPLTANEARPPRHFRDMNKDQPFSAHNREIIWQDDLEGTQEPWQSESGWMLSSNSYHSPVHAWWIDDETGNSGLNHLVSPLIQLPENWLELTLKYWYYSDLIDYDGDGNNLLDDYWMLYITDPDQAIAWHSSSVNGYLGGTSWYAGSDETETYGNASAYYLYMPPFTLPPANAAQLDCLLDYNIEAPGGASSPYDGWDVANVQITTDNWLTYEFLQDPVYPYNVQVGYAGYYNSGNPADTLYYPGWAGANANGWFAASFNLDEYLGETIGIRFCLNTDAMNVAGGFWVDNVELIVNSSTLFSDYDEENLLPDESLLNWYRLSIDYGISSGWSESPEYDISDFAGQNVHIRLTTRLDDNYDGGDGTGFWLDDVTINGSNYSVYDGAALFTLVPYPTTAGVEIHPGIVYGNTGQFNINPELRLDVEDLGGDYDYYALSPGEILPGQNDLGWLTPLTGFTLESGTYNFTGKVLAAGDQNTTNNQFTFENIQINQPGVYELGFNSRIWDGSFVSSTACGTYFDPFTQELLSDLFYLNSVKLLLINDGYSDFPVETFDISIWEAIDDLTLGELLYSESISYTAGAAGEYAWAEFQLTDPVSLQTDFFIIIDGEYTNGGVILPLFDNTVRQFTGEGAYTEHTVFWNGTDWAHSSGDRFINACGFDHTPDLLLPPYNLQINEESGSLSWQEPAEFIPGDEFSQGFEEEEIPEDWLLTDLDGDEEGWFLTDSYPHEGIQSIASASWLSGTGGINPDNWLISPPFLIGSNSELRFWYASDDATWPNEHFAVLLSRSGSDIDDFEDVIFETTLSSAEWIEAVIDLSAHAGWTVRLAWRHYNCSNWYRLKIDDIAVISYNETNYGKETRELLGYNVYLDSILAGNTTDLNFTFEDLWYGQTYLAGVSAVYSSGESNPVELEFVYQGTGLSTETLPSLAALGNYPNPFNPSTRIDFQLAGDEFTVLEIFNLKGEKIITLCRKNLTAGKHSYFWNGLDEKQAAVASGIYFYTLSTGKNSITEKMLLLK